MPLTINQIRELKDALHGYQFPFIYYDFEKNIEIAETDMKAVEVHINTLLRSNNYLEVKNGLSNVLYWGYGQIPIRDFRVKRFRNNVKNNMLEAFISLTLKGNVPSLSHIRDIGLPEYSGMSFVTKILMFLCPEKYCVLDQQIAKLRLNGSEKALNNLVFKNGDTIIRITRNNENVYARWCKECEYISRNYYSGIPRVVDIERGFFNLIQQGNVLNARTIYNSV